MGSLTAAAAAAAATAAAAQNGRCWGSRCSGRAEQSRALGARAWAPDSLNASQAVVPPSRSTSGRLPRGVTGLVYSRTGSAAVLHQASRASTAASAQQSRPFWALATMECVVQGILEAKHVDALEVLLQGLCGGLRETIKVHEICLKTGPNLGAVASEVHLCCSLSQPEPVWSVRHVGGAMRGAGAEQLPALVRPVLEAAISNNSLRFMHALGYKLDYEMLRTGFSFQMHKTVPIAVTITIAVTAVHRLPKTHAVDDAQPVTPGLHMVQLTAPASPDNYSDVVGAISGLAEYLAPLVHLSKPGVPAGIVPTASTAAAALVSRGGITKVL